MSENNKLNTLAQDLDMLLSSYAFDLPPELIAQRPIDGVHRDQSKLLVYNAKSNEIIHDHFYNITNYLPKDSLLVFNRSKVFPSRIFGAKKTGGKVEVFFLSHDQDEKSHYPVLIKTRAKKNIGDTYYFDQDLIVEVADFGEDGTFKVKVTLPKSYKNLLDYLEKNAHIPIPPYIREGKSDEADKINYQTVYSKESGSVAAPTAGLHFTSDLLEKIKNHGVDEAFVTLHVGLGTFRPVSADHLADHKMHTEEYFITNENLEKIRSAKKTFAVGTTSLRVLESSYGKEIHADEHYHTNIFLHPGVNVKSIDGLVTNFHLPESTLLMLVSSLIGREKTLELYKIAIENKYRFFSYGDAMLVIR